MTRIQDFGAALTPYGEAPALFSEGRSVSFARLATLIDSFSARLDAAGVQPGDTIACTVPDWLVQVISRYAALSMGLKVVLPPDPRGFARTGQRLDWLLTLAGETAEAGMAIPFTQDWISKPLERQQSPRRDGILIGSSSGSTGLPKYFGITTPVFQDWIDLYSNHHGPEEGPVLICTPVFTLFGLFLQAKALEDGQLSIGTQGGVPETLALAARLGVTELVATPAILNEILNAIAEGAPRPAFNRIKFGGAVAPVALLERARTVFPGVRLFVFSGSGEGGGFSSGYIDDPAANPEGWSGRPYHGMEIQLRQKGEFPEFGPDVGLLATRYAYRDQTLGYFGGDPIHDSGGWIATSDLVRIAPDGSLVHVGRHDFVLNLGGQKIAPEVFEAMLGSLPGIRAVAVVQLGEPTERRIGVFVEAGNEFDPDAVARSLQSKMNISAELEIHRLGKLPSLTSGKIDRQALRAQVAK